MFCFVLLRLRKDYEKVVGPTISDYRETCHYMYMYRGVRILLSAPLNIKHNKTAHHYIDLLRTSLFSIDDVGNCHKNNLWIDFEKVIESLGKTNTKIK